MRNKKIPTSMSTTDARMKFHDVMQSIFGREVDAVAFQRYGRILGAVVHIDAIAMLAGEPVPAERQDQIRNGMRALLATLEGDK